MSDMPGQRWIEYVKVDDLPEQDHNPKGHDDEGISASLDRFGYTEPVMLDERTGRLIAGHGRKGRLVARRDAGGAVPDGVLLDDTGAWLVPVVRGWSSADDLEADAYLVASNRLTEKGGWVTEPLAAILSELTANSPRGLDGIGYTQPDLDQLLSSIAPTPNFTPDDAQPRLDSRSPIVCPSCGHSFHRV